MPVINKIETHLDRIDAMKVDIKNDIEGLFEKLNVKNFIRVPGDSVDAVIFAIGELMTKKYLKRIIKESQRYAKSVVESKEKL